jgi:hypothetical protein
MSVAKTATKNFGVGVVKGSPEFPRHKVRGEDTYNPDDVNIWRYVARRGFVNKIIFKE